MTEPAAPQTSSDAAPAVPAPRVVTRRRRNISWIWLVPLVAALVGLSLVAKKWINTGPTVTISFESAESLEVGQTKIRYKNVVVGVVKDITLSKDRSHVLVKARLNRDSAGFIARKGTRFWVVRPRLGLSGVSGLGTLFSGAYIGVDIAKSQETGADSRSVYTFKGLEKPPEITSDKPGTRYTLTASDLGSLELGSPVYYRRIQVGRVIDYDLAPDGKKVNIQIFVDSPSDKFITANTRFWNVSGINMSLSADGFSVNTGSLTSIIAGGIAFAAPEPQQGMVVPVAKPAAPVKANAVFPLKATRQAAMADPDGPAIEINMEFQQSVRGLKVGAPVDFHGLELGTVADIDLEYDGKAKHFYVLVKTKIYPMRFGMVYRKMMASNAQGENAGHLPLAALVRHGLRAQMRPANLLTGQQYIALDFFPKAAPARFDENAVPLMIPTVAGNFDRLQQQITSIVTKLDAIPYAGISHDLQASLQAMARLLNGVNKDLGPDTAATLKAVRRSLDGLDKLLGSDSASGGNLSQTLNQLSQAAKSLRALTDYLQAHPSSLIRGHPADVLPPSH